MLLFENFRVALEAIFANKMRSILTVLGIIIGTAAVIGVVSIIQGFQHSVTQQLSEVGTTKITVFPDFGNQGPGVVARQVRLTWEDGLAMRDTVDGIRHISPLVGGGMEVKYRDRQHQPGLVIGVNEDWQEVSNQLVERGRFLSRLDLERRRKVAVIGPEVVEELQLGREPIGKEIYVGFLPVTVIGVMEEMGQSLGQNLDDQVFLPFATALGIFGRRAGQQIQIHIQAESAERVDEVVDGVSSLLRRRHGIAEGDPDDFLVLKQDQLLEFASGVIGTVTAVVAAIVGVALLVAGIGIMNIMLVSVTERTREIGLRKSVGARRRDILIQFLIEAITLALIGGAIGQLVGYGIGVLAVQLIPGDLPPAHVPIWAVALSFGFCTLVGVVFGIYPASRAARLDPIEALRYE